MLDRWNVEIKAEFRKDIGIIHSVLRAESADFSGAFWQEDYYFNCLEVDDPDADERLPRFKLRAQTADRQDWTCFFIWYDRDDKRGPKTSRYRIAPVEVRSKEALMELVHTLDAAWGVFEKVEKQREVYRVHGDYPDVLINVDEVTNLGYFVELEALIADDNESEHRAAVHKLDRLRRLLHIEDTDLVRRSYADEIQRRRRR